MKAAKVWKGGSSRKQWKFMARVTKFRVRFGASASVSIAMMKMRSRSIIAVNRPSSSKSCYEQSYKPVREAQYDFVFDAPP